MTTTLDFLSTNSSPRTNFFHRIEGGLSIEKAEADDDYLEDDS